MEFRLDEGQVALQETIARFCADRFPLDALSAREGVGVDPVVWAEVADMGVFGLTAPEEAGGSALGAVEAALVFEQLGSHLAAGPLLWTTLAGPLVDGAVGGAQVVGGVEGGAVDADGVAVVEHAADLDVVLVLGDDDVVAHRPDAATPVEPLDPLDPLTPVGRISLGDGAVVGDATDARRLRLLGTVLGAAELCGVASRALEVARDYALERHQFDRPIGSFQAVQHLLADAYVRAGLAQSATYAAAAVLADPGGDDPAPPASAAKVVASDAALTNAATAIQVLGGMGFTWEMLPNYLLKRAWLGEHRFGPADDHAAALGTALVETNR